MVISTSRRTIPIRQLPIQPRPRAGEGRTAFIEHLATANFLKPSFLRGYLRDPDSPKTAPSWERLAAVTGRDPVRLREIQEGKQCVECGRPLPIMDYLTPRQRCSQACRQKSYRKRTPKPLKAIRITNCQGCGTRDGPPSRTRSRSCRHHHRHVRGGVARQIPDNLALAYADIGDLIRAIPLHESTLIDRERILGSDHPRTLASRLTIR
ncbi:tetratricopeptide repeat protein [Streptomyces sp. NPDC093093]|uniref:tetratricopeptide repeat protein n=1 Tax=Streptomyces sp. NPDC093093 TaxID=3366025 RepID=UPI003803614B